MSIEAWIVVLALVYLALGAFVSAPMRSSSPMSRRRPPVERVDRDKPLDITPALRGRR